MAQSEHAETYEGTYTLANLNPWDALADIVHIEQTFDINAAGEYVNISTISYACIW